MEYDRFVQVFLKNSTKVNAAVKILREKLSRNDIESAKKSHKDSEKKFFFRNSLKNVKKKTKNEKRWNDRWFDLCNPTFQGRSNWGLFFRKKEKYESRKVYSEMLLTVCISEQKFIEEVINLFYCERNSDRSELADFQVFEQNSEFCRRWTFYELSR